MLQVFQKVTAPFCKHDNSQCLYSEKIWNKKMSHSAYREYIVQYHISISLITATSTKRKLPVPIDNTQMRLSGKHFVSKLDTVVWVKKESTYSKVQICNFTHEQLAHYGHSDLQLPDKYSPYRCKTCSSITLCITPCFEIFHSNGTGTYK